ncbi:hypothetical protein BDA99DRAFT_533547 [Phascolomyces articulosus]|uniref:Uncharacterized protein n=1 Tax=Phascolomyces articulosus TaxID=60185 RepID=A0AAD5K762_9FUNG|nr:hypothetical protein BDA99DRAFT_533547 [Phascolomyces articulosus]
MVISVEFILLNRTKLRGVYMTHVQYPSMDTLARLGQPRCVNPSPSRPSPLSTTTEEATLANACQFTQLHPPAMSHDKKLCSTSVAPLVRGAPNIQCLTLYGDFSGQDIISAIGNLNHLKILEIRCFYTSDHDIQNLIAILIDKKKVPAIEELIIDSTEYLTLITFSSILKRFAPCNISYLENWMHP